MAEEHAHKEKEVAQKRDRRPLIVGGLILLIIGGGAAGLAYWSVSQKTVSIENAQIEAPVVTLSPTEDGILEHVYVTEGEVIPPDTVVAQVGVEEIKSTDGGLVLTALTDLGSAVTPSDAVVTTIDPTQLQVVGQLQEDKGLADVAVGDEATFTVDAFGSKQFTGVVSEVAPVANSGDVVFNISDQREEQDFDVKVKFDTQANPDLKQGMSAKIWVYKQ